MDDAFDGARAVSRQLSAISRDLQRYDREVAIPLRETSRYSTSGDASCGTFLRNCWHRITIFVRTTTFEEGMMKMPNRFAGTVRAAQFPEGLEWINCEPLTIERLRGKVVILDFWTYC
jgi:hypothetical protein